MASLAAIRHERRVALDRAQIIWNRNNALRRSSTGRLLLVLEGCISLINDKREMSSHGLSQLIDDLSHASALADEAGIQHGWIRHGIEEFALVFAISTGDVVFSGLNENLGTDSFPSEPVVSDNSWTVARAINQILSEEKNSSLRRSTRIPADVRVKVQGDGFACLGDTVTVNLHGALVRSSAPVKLGDRITLYVMQTGKCAPGAVVFANPTARQFGIELQHPENIWGVSSPPPDWNVRIAN